MQIRLTALAASLLLAACSSSPTLFDEMSAVGSPCPNDGPPSHSGVWGGSSDWTCRAPIDGTEVSAYTLGPDGRLHLGICNTVPLGGGESCDLAADIHLYVEAAQVGVHAIDGESVRVRSSTGEALAGQIEILGYDPEAARVCVRYDVVMEDGFTMRGELNASNACTR